MKLCEAKARTDCAVGRSESSKCDQRLIQAVMRALAREKPVSDITFFDRSQAMCPVDWPAYFCWWLGDFLRYCLHKVAEHWSTMLFKIHMMPDEYDSRQSIKTLRINVDAFNKRKGIEYELKRHGNVYYIRQKNLKQAVLVTGTVRDCDMFIIGSLFERPNNEKNVHSDVSRRIS